MSIKKLITDIKNNPTIINDLNEKQLETLLIEANDYYYNKDKPLFNDEIYDLIKDRLIDINEDNEVLKSVGAPITDAKEKVKLPYLMGSLDKIKTDNKVINNWISKYKGDYILSDKLDGISALLHVRNNISNLYTRGDGSYGMNITNMLKYIENIPKNITDDISIRGELIISKKNWEKIKDLGTNPRNMVSGIFNSKKPNTKLLKYVEFVAYQLLYPENVLPSEQYDIIAKTGIKPVKYNIVKKIDSDILSNYFDTRRKNCNYEIDGIVVYNNAIYEEEVLNTGKTQRKNPKYAFAFKNILTNESAEVTVIDVEWNISKHRLVKPVVIFNPVFIDGSTVQRATGFNAKYIVDNNIGPGSKLVVIKSGSIIPYIQEVIKGSDSGKGKMPNYEYVWDTNNIDILINEEHNDEAEIKIITNFFTKFKAKGISEGIITKLYNAGFNTIRKVLDITIDNLLTVDGIQQKSATNIYNSINNIDLTDNLTLMVASNTFGRGLGERKLKPILTKYPDIINNTPTLSDITNIEGFSTITGNQFLNNLEKFKEFLTINRLEFIVKKQNNSKKIKIIKNSELFEKNILFTGFRDKDIESKIIERGGIIKSTLNNKVDILLIKDSEVSNKKTESAADMNIEIITKDDFITKYL